MGAVGRGFQSQGRGVEISNKLVRADKVGSLRVPQQISWGGGVCRWLSDSYMPSGMIANQLVEADLFLDLIISLTLTRTLKRILFLTQPIAMNLIPP